MLSMKTDAKILIHYSNHGENKLKKNNLLK